jgi:ribosomal protein L32
MVSLIIAMATLSVRRSGMQFAPHLSIRAREARRFKMTAGPDAIVCPKCGQANLPGRTLCFNCFAQLTAGPARTNRLATITSAQLRHRNAGLAVYAAGLILCFASFASESSPFSALTMLVGVGLMFNGCYRLTRWKNADPAWTLLGLIPVVGGLVLSLMRAQPSTPPAPQPIRQLGKCPQCGSQQITEFYTSTGGGFDASGPACCVGCLFFLPLALLSPWLKSSPHHELHRRCQSCGYQWRV